MLRTAMLTLGLVLAPLAVASAEEAGLDGKALFATKTCIACHGRNGARAIQVFPNIAAQDAAYLLAQMNDIADGKRVSGNDERGYPRTQGMKDVMHLVSPAERAAIADYLAKAEPAKVKPLDPPIDDARRAEGKLAYTKGGCQTCHGPDGLKPLAGYPILGGMKRDYLVLQMTEIRDGIRQNGKVKTMLPFAKKLDEAKIAAIADYLSQIERAPK
ncbi:c-type cytochrome [Pinisolibacter aquiterrae]|uniref:c-type cytochrome n=1 Tax=Pinisolibacter aquiterrae TaxID=2815579 RepID=UPI001C3CFCB3|nr:c-type cytochrome [Pinisolibacter aquiterrae]MBV5265747.1 c-type cytochrome [Pinisolibacter aquiterrae]MCC8236688.1 c-type cytochrome [Pinisolibacter aquiterrae]